MTTKKKTRIAGAAPVGESLEAVCRPSSPASPHKTTQLEGMPFPKGRFYITIPSYERFTDEERALYDAGHYPMLICEHLPEHVRFLDYLIDQAAAEWKRRFQNKSGTDDEPIRDSEGVGR